MSLAESALGRFADRRKSRNQQIIERLALGNLLSESLRPRPQGFVRERNELIFQRIDGGHARLVRTDASFVRRTKDFPRQTADHRSFLLPHSGLRGRAFGRVAWWTTLAIRNCGAFRANVRRDIFDGTDRRFWPRDRGGSKSCQF